MQKIVQNPKFESLNDSDKKIVYECYNAIAKINTLESVEFLDTIIKNKTNILPH